MKKQMLIFGAMAIGALAFAGKRTYDIIKLKQAREQNIVEIEVESTDDSKNSK